MIQIQSVTVTVMMIIFLQRFSTCSGSNNQFMAANDCACRGHIVTYECTVFGNGATVWKGTAFDCSLASNEFVFIHGVNYTLQNPLICNNGAIVGNVVRAENDSYTSQITVEISDELNGTTVVCAYDNGTVAEIGSAVLNITTVSFPPLSYIQLVEANSTNLRFNWSHVLSHCPSIQYHIMALNCGECPPTTHSNTVTCSRNYTKLMSYHLCSFAVGTAVCNGTLGDISIAINVPTTPAENLHTEKGVIIRLIVSATVIPVVVLMGIALALGLVLVYLLISRNSSKTNTEVIFSKHSRSTPGANTHNVVEVELTTTDNNLQGIGVYSYLQSTKDQNQNSNSMSTDDITYVDLCPNTTARAANLTLLHDDGVQYEEIQLESATEEPVCGPQTKLVNLDLLLILLKEELTPRWYEFGLVVGIPKDVMDSYLGYPSDQCLIEVFDYWLRHYIGQLTWKDVAQALREAKFYHLAEKALQISTTGKFPLESHSSNFSHHDLETKEFPSRNATESPPALPHEQLSLRTTKCISSTSEYEETQQAYCLCRHCHPKAETLDKST